MGADFLPFSSQASLSLGLTDLTTEASNLYLSSFPSTRLFPTSCATQFLSPQHPKPSIYHIVSNTALRDPANHYNRLYKHSCISSLNPAIPPECQANLSSKQRQASELLFQLESNPKSSSQTSEPSCHG